MPSFRANIPAGSSYKLLELPPELLESIQNGELLTVKAPSTASNMVVCTGSTTYKLRQMNQTNTLMLLRPYDSHVTDNDGDVAGESHLEGFGSVASYLEPVKTHGTVDFSILPRYTESGELESGSESIHMSLQQLKASSLCSDTEFDKFWSENAGIEVNGVAALIHDKYSKVLLEQLLASVVAARLGMQNLEMGAVLKCTDGEHNVMSAVVRRFSEANNDGRWTIDKVQVSKWIGLQVLKKYAFNNDISVPLFMEFWKEAVPVQDSDWQFDLSLLSGNYVEPKHGSIRYLTRGQLSDNAKVRFTQLFSVKSQWDLDEMVPFIDDLRNKTTKLESFVMKHARKKAVGKRILISAR